MDETRSGANPLGEVPVVNLVNMPRLTDALGSDGRSRYTRGEAEHEAVLPLIDLYNKTLLDMATTSEFQAFPQRYAIGVDFGDGEGYELDSDGEPAEDDYGVTKTQPPQGQTGPDRMLAAESPDAKFGQFQVADLQPYIEALKQIERQLATITHTPHRKLVPPPTSVPPSGESVRLSDEGLTEKVTDKHDAFGASWRAVFRLVFLWLGDQRKADKRPTIEWHDPQVRTESEHMDALSKQQALGIPDEFLWEQVPYTPQEIEHIRELLESDLDQKLEAQEPTDQSVPLTPQQEMTDNG
jgi:hypothetical protein